MTGRVCVLFACALLLPWPAAGQGLGDAAARERARRAKESASKGSGAPTYTNEDLPAGTGPEKTDHGQTPPTASAPAAAGRPAETTGSAETTPSASQRALAEQAHVDAVAAAQRRIEAIEARIRELQAMLNPMSTTYIYGATGSSNRADEEIRARAELRDSDGRLAAARQALEAATQALADFRAGRRTAPPPAQH